MSTPLAVVILTLNEERNLPDCLSSLGDLQAEIFVVDSGSDDRTVPIAKAAGATVFEHPFDNYGAQRNRAQDMIPPGFEWFLHIDADERLTPDLVGEINGALRSDSAVDGYMLRKRTIFMGRWIRHGGHYPSFHLRLFRRDRGRCEDRLYDQHFLVDGNIETMANDYLDVVASDITTWTRRHLRWAQLEADEISADGRGREQVRPRLLGTPIERRRWLRHNVLYRPPLLFRPFLYFLYRYFLRFGFLDGKDGLIFHFLQGCWYRFMIDAVIYERRRSPQP